MRALFAWTTWLHWLYRLLALGAKKTRILVLADSSVKEPVDSYRDVNIYQACWFG
jgi:hypothetical protein